MVDKPCMPNGYKNWNFKQVVSVLKKNGFIEVKIQGSHFHYYSSDKKALVQVPFHGNTSIKPRTLKSIVLSSKIPSSIWGIKK